MPGNRAVGPTVAPELAQEALTKVGGGHTPPNYNGHGVCGVAGVVSWHQEAYGPTVGSFAWNIGIGLAETCRGHGVGSVAQRLVAEWLFASTPLDRVEASTDVDNVAERRSLEKAGFTLEGVLRGAQARADGVHDLVGYSLLRSDLAG